MDSQQLRAFFPLGSFSHNGNVKMVFFAVCVLLLQQLQSLVNVSVHVAIEQHFCSLAFPVCLIAASLSSGPLFCAFTLPSE